MFNFASILRNRRTSYLAAWLAYMLFTLSAFPAFSITVMLFSIVLSMVGAWLYSYPGWLLTTALTIPYHYLMLMYLSDDPASWNEAFNPFGISTQLIISGSIALLRSTRDSLDSLKTLLEKKIETRTRELRSLNGYIIGNYEKEQALLSHTLLQNIGESLRDMQKESAVLGSSLLASDNPNAFQAARLNQLIRKTIDWIHNLRFIDYSIRDEQVEYTHAIRRLAHSFQETAGTHFDMELSNDLDKIPEATIYQLYRITHEAVTNAVRHGNARRVEITLEVNNDHWVLTVVNNGTPLPKNLKEGSGTSIIRQRARAINATTSIERTRDGRTRFVCASNQNHIE